MRTTMPWSDTSYPAIRRVMGPSRHQLDDEALEDLLVELFPQAVPGDVEDFMRTVQSFGKQVAPLAQRALPGIVQGAVTGATVAGPWGAVAGAIGGGAASLLGGSRSAPGAQPAQPPRLVQPAQPPGVSPPLQEPAVSPPAQVPGIAPAVASPVAGATAPAQLMALLSRPETLQALLSLLMSGAGRGTVQVGSQAVPPPAFANAISELAEEAAEHAAAPAGGIAGYLLDPRGNPRCDIANPAERASLLLADIASVVAEEANEDREIRTRPDDIGLSMAAEAVEESNPLDSYEAALEGRSRYDG
jgi:hypothetical protein